MPDIRILNAFYRFRKLIASFVIVIGFFAYYNVFLIDHTLENLQFSLEQTALAYDISDTKGLDIVLRQVMTMELTPLRVDAFSMGNLEYAANIVNEGKHFQQLDYIELTLSSVVEDKEKKRGAFLGMLDRINRPVRNAVIDIANKRYGVLRPKVKVRDPGEVVSEEFIKKIKEIEKEEDLNVASLRYKKLIAENIEEQDVAILKLRLAYIYHRMSEYDKAMEMYKEIVRTYYPSQEAKIAQILIYSLGQMERLKKEADSLIRTIEKHPQFASSDAYYKVGTIYMQLFNFDEAANYFRKVFELFPKRDIALKARFNLAWILKQQNRYDESLEEFSNIVDESPKSDLVLKSFYQIADILYTQERYQEAVDACIRIADDYKGEPISSLCLFQAGNIYMYDLNDPDKAQEIFDRLVSEYPDSPYSKHLTSQKNVVAMFITQVVPGTRRILAWRIAGLLCLSGYSGKLVQGSAISTEESLAASLNGWCDDKFPYRVGGVPLDINDVEADLKKDKILVSAMINFWKFNMEGKAEAYLGLTKDRRVNIGLASFSLGGVPITPILINTTLERLSAFVTRFFPIIITEIDKGEDKFSIEGIGGNRRLFDRIQPPAESRLGASTEIGEIADPAVQQKVTDIFKKRFPASNFSLSPEYDAEFLFLDFFTKACLFTGYKLSEILKNSKIDYEWSVATLGKLVLKEDRFRADYTKEETNTALKRFLSKNSPWLLNKQFLYNPKSLCLNFTEKGEIEFASSVSLGHSGYEEFIKFDEKASDKKECTYSVSKDLLVNYDSGRISERRIEGIYDINLKGIIALEIDEKSGLPRFIVTEVSLNGKSYPTEKLNMISASLQDILKDIEIPLKFEEILVSKKGISLRGTGCRDYAARLFPSPSLLLDVFDIEPKDGRPQNGGMAGIEIVEQATDKLRNSLSAVKEDNAAIERIEIPQQ